MIDIDVHHIRGVSVRVAPADDADHLALAARYSVPTRRWLWTPEDEIEFIPPVSRVVYGDGKQLLGMTTTHNRPQFWVVRIDSGWNIETSPNSQPGPDIQEFIETIAFNLIAEYGEADAWSATAAEKDPFPAIDLNDGYSWFAVAGDKAREQQNGA